MVFLSTSLRSHLHRHRVPAVLLQLARCLLLLPGGEQLPQDISYCQDHHHFRPTTLRLLLYSAAI